MADIVLSEREEEKRPAPKGPTMESVARDMAREEAAAAPVVSMEEAAAQMKDEADDRKARDLAVSQFATQGVDPDKAANAYRIGMERNISTEAVLADYDFYANQQRMEGTDWKAVIEEAPVAAQTMTNRDTAAIVGPDGRELTVLERMYRDITGKWRAGNDMVEGGAIGWRRMIGAGLPQDMAKLAEIEQRQKKHVEYFDFTKGPGEFLLGIPGQATESLPFLAETITSGADEAAVGLAGGAGVGAAGGLAAGGVGAVPGAIAGGLTGAGIGLRVGMGIRTGQIEAGNAFNSYLRMKGADGQPVGEDAARGAALVVGIANGMLETVAFTKLLSVVPGASRLAGRVGMREIARALSRSPTALAAFRSFGRKVATVGLTEALTEGAQELSTITGSLLAGAEYDESGKRITAASAASQVATAAVKGAQGGIGMAAVPSAVGSTMELQRARRATQRETAFKAMGDAARNSKVVQRLPEGLRRFVEQVKEEHGTVEEVYVDPEALGRHFQQEKISPDQIARTSPELAENIRRAVDEGTEVAIPIEDFAEISRSENFDALIPDVRLHPDEMTGREAEAYRQELDQTMQEAGVEETPGDVIETRVQQQLVDAGQAPDVAQKNAKLTRAFYETQAERAGIPVEELAERYGITVQGDTINEASTPLAGLIDELRETGVPEPPAAEAELTEQEVERNVALRELGRVIEEAGIDITQLTTPEAVEELTAGRMEQAAVQLQTQPLEIEGSGPGGRVTNWDLGEALTARHMGTYGRALDPTDPADYQTVLQSMSEEYANQAVQQDAGHGWYVEDVASAIAITKNIIPELEVPEHRDLFLTIAALLSPQRKPLDNWENAILAMQGYVESDGRIALRKPTGKQFGVPSHTTGLQLLQHLIDTMGLEDALEWIKAPHTGREMAEIRKASGLFKTKADTVASYTANETNLNDAYPGIAIFGPKVSDFMMNATGFDPGAVTVDLWLARTYNRLTGRLLDVTPQQLEKREIRSDLRGKAEREIIKSLVRDAAEQNDITPSAMQAALWYFEQRLFRSHGLQAASQNFEDAAVAAAEKRSLPVTRTGVQPEGVGEAVPGVLRQEPKGLALLDFIRGNPEGFTVDPVTGEQPTTGYVVAPIKEAEMIVSTEELSDEVINTLFENYYMLSEATGAPMGVGGWFNQADGQYYLDVVEIVEDRNEALYLAEAGDQIAIFDLGSGNEITTAEGVQALREAGTYDNRSSAEQRAKQEKLRSLFAEGRVQDRFRQEGVTTPRGYIDVAGDTLDITLTGKADLSTFLHESGHAYLEVMRRMVRDGVASDQQRADYQTLVGWLELTEGQTIPRQAHEKFARGFEMYLAEGRAPSTELASIFRAFKQWLITVYRTLTMLDVQLNDDIRQVMDRLVASDDAIREARTSIGTEQMMDREALSVLTDDEYASYRETFIKEQERAELELDRKAYEEAARQQRKAWKAERDDIVATMKAELDKTQGAQAISELASRRAEGKIATRSLTPQQARRLPKTLHARNGTPADLLAEEFDYPSGEALIADVEQTRTRQNTLRQRADEIMRDRHGEMSPLDVAEAAMEAAHSDQQQSLLLTELRGMSEGMQLAPLSAVRKAINAAAAERIGNMATNKILPSRYRQAELRAAKDAVRLAAEGDRFGAVVAKRQQLLNNALYREAVKAHKDVTSIRAYLRRFTTRKKRAELGRASTKEYSYIDAIDNLLEGIDFVRRSEAAIAERQRLDDFVQQAEARDETVIIPDHLMAGGETNYRHMTPDELRAVRDAVRMIDRQARMKNKLTYLGQTRDIDAVLDEVEAAAEQSIKGRKPVQGFSPTTRERLGSRWHKLNASMMKAEFIFRLLDGVDSGGPLSKAIFQPIAEAQHERNDMRKDMLKKMNDIFQGMSPEARTRLGTKHSFMGRTAYGYNIMAAALNTGNEQNLDKLARGYGWNPDQLMAELDAWMTKEDWDTVQKIWDLIDTLYPHLNEVQKKATGLPLERVEATPVETRHGTYKGGYYPIRYDPTQDARQEDFAEVKMAGMFSYNATNPKARSSAAFSRKEGYAAPILLNLDVIPQHIYEVTHFVTHYDAVVNAHKLMRHPRFRNIVNRTLGREYYTTALRPWLKAIADDGVIETSRNEWWKAIEFMRGGVTYAAMGWRLTSAAKQLLGTIPAINFIGPHWMAYGMGKAMMGKQVWSDAFAKSGELRHTMENMDRDIRWVMQGKWEKVGLGRVRTGAQFLNQHAFALMGWAQMAANVGVWEGAYQKAISRGDTEADAVAYADSMVRQSQSAGAMKDLSEMQRDTRFRMFTMFMSYFTTLYNILYVRAKERGITRPHLLALDAATLLAAPVLVEMLIDKMFSDEDDEQEFLTEFLLYVAGTVPILRDIVSASVGPYRTYKPTSAFDPAVKIGQGVAGAFDKDGMEEKDLVRLMEGIGQLMRLPTSEIKRMWQLFSED